MPLFLWRATCGLGATALLLIACSDDTAAGGGGAGASGPSSASSGGSGAGETTCEDGLIACGQSCVDTETDIDHCSGCGNACSSLPNTEASCADSVCVLTCVAGTDECDNDESNGCELEIFCTAHKLVFVSSDTYDGNLGGLEGADAKCQALAEAAGHAGTFMAWLSDGVDSPSTRFSQSPVAHLLVDGTLVATGWADLIDGTIEHAIDLDESGQPGPDAELEQCMAALAVWSATTIAGESLDSHCGGWLDDTSPLIATGHRGAVDAGWTNQCLVEEVDPPEAWCGGEAPIYCFEQ